VLRGRPGAHPRASTASDTCSDEQVCVSTLTAAQTPKQNHWLLQSKYQSALCMMPCSTTPCRDGLIKPPEAKATTRIPPSQLRRAGQSASLRPGEKQTVVETPKMQRRERPHLECLPPRSGQLFACDAPALAATGPPLSERCTTSVLLHIPRPFSAVVTFARTESDTVAIP
jgi:hypothetical protein